MNQPAVVTGLVSCLEAWRRKSRKSRQGDLRWRHMDGHERGDMAQRSPWPVLTPIRKHTQWKRPQMTEETSRFDLLVLDRFCQQSPPPPPTPVLESTNHMVMVAKMKTMHKSTWITTYQGQLRLPLNFHLASNRKQYWDLRMSLFLRETNWPLGGKLASTWQFQVVGQDRTVKFSKEKSGPF